jgi:hypothetical protein
MLTRRHYEEFVKPYDQSLLDEFGGCIHFCGRGNAFTRSMLESRRLYGINSSQPELNDVVGLLDQAWARRVTVVGIAERYVPAGRQTGAIVLHQRA